MRDLSISEIESIERKVTKNLAEIDLTKKDHVGELVFNFNNDCKDMYKEISNISIGSGIKIMIVGTNERAYPISKINGQDYSSIRVCVNPIEMYGMGNGNYQKNLEKYNTIITTIKDLAK